MRKPGSNEKGVALVIALIILLVMTLIGMASISSSVFEAKISGNDRFGTVAFYAAKGGAERGISQLPNLNAYSDNIGDGTYRSGRMSDGGCRDLEYVGAMGRPGYDINWEFKRYRVNATGQSFGAMNEIEVQLSMGPHSSGTQYNN